MKKLAIILLLLIGTASVRAQITKALPTDFKEIKSRVLIVELLVEDREFIKKQRDRSLKAKKPEDKKKYQKLIEDHKTFVASFNEVFKTMVEKHWDLNQEVIYKTKPEVAKIRKAKSTKYTVLFFSESNTTSYSGGYYFNPEFNIPTLNYSRIEKNLGKIDYSFFMPSTGSMDINIMAKSDFIISLKIMKNHIAEIERSSNKGYTAKKYGKGEWTKNCSDLKGKKITLDKSRTKKPATEFSKECPNDIELLEAEEVSQLIYNEVDEIIGINIPYDIKVAGGGAISVARVMFMKTLVNAKTGKIYYVNGIATGQMYDHLWRPKQMGKVANCK